MTRRAVWVARYSDRSGAVVFGTELEALRHAVDRSMEVVRVPYGVDIFEHPAVVESDAVAPTGVGNSSRVPESTNTPEGPQGAVQGRTGALPGSRGGRD